MSFFKSKQATLADNRYDEQVHGTVASEIAAGELVPGLWAKAFAQADGNEQRAKAIYIKLRVEQIKLGNAAQAEQMREAEKVLNRLTPPTQDVPVSSRRTPAVSDERPPTSVLSR